MKQEWEEVKSGEYWLPQIGEEIIGVITRIESNDEFGKQYTLDVKSLGEVTLPSHKVLQSKLNKCIRGELVKIVYVKNELPKVKTHKPTRIYDVFRQKIELVDEPDLEEERV